MDENVLQFLADLERNGAGVSSPNDNRSPAGQRPCPTCQEHMQVEYQQKVPVDVCPSHGLRLDRGELANFAGRIRSGERVSRGDTIKDARRDGKVSGMLPGGWSLLLD